MNALWPTLLWKEWRDHKLALLAFPIAIAPLIAFGIGMLPAHLAKQSVLPTFVMFGAFAIAALTLVADLVPGEEQRGTLTLLRRLPHGLAPVFIAKLVFALLATTAICGIGYLAATVASALLRDGPWFPTIEVARMSWLYRAPHGNTDVAWWAGALLLAAWMFAVSTWLPRGALALPAAALLLALFVAPIVLAFLAKPGMRPRGGDELTALRGLLVAAPIVAGISFTLGRRRGGGLGASAWRGLLATLAVFTPAYARTAWYVARWDRVDPSDPTFQIQAWSGTSFVGSSGRHALITVQNGDGAAPNHALAVDLSDGNWRELGRAGDRFAAIGNLFSGRVAVPFVTRCSDDLFGRSFANAHEAEAAMQRWIVLDTATLATKAAASIKKTPDPFKATEESSEFQRVANSARLPGGRHVWMRGGELVTEADGGGVRVLPDSQTGRTALAIPIGHGMRMYGGGGDLNCIYDATRERRFELLRTIHEVWIRAGRWPVEREIDPQHLPYREHCLYEPTTGECSPLPAAIANAHFCAVLDDGRLLALLPDAEDARLRTVALVDPESGASEAIALPPWFHGKVRTLDVMGRTPAGALVVELRGTRDPENLKSAVNECFARLDVAARRFVAARDGDHPYDELLGCPDEESVILVEAGRRLVRVHFGDPRTELLFPRSATESER